MNKENQRNDSELYREYLGLKGFSLQPWARENSRFAFLENMYIDREGGGGLESIPGFRRLIGSEENIHSLALQICEGEKFIIFHSGNRLYRMGYRSGECSLIAEISGKESRMTVFGSLVLINDGEALYSLDGSGNLNILSSENFILGCRSVALFDGRLFFSANKELKGEIFYSTRLCEQIVLSQDNHIYEGGDISHILAHRGRLWVFRSAESEICETVCHTCGEGYPISLTLEGFDLITAPLAIGEEIFLLTEQGLLAIEIPDGKEAKTSNYSLDINPMLLRENLKDAGLLLWKNYIMIGCGRHIYLGDRFSTKGNIDWYFLNGIGSHSGDRRVFRYSKACENGYNTHKATKEKARGEVISLKTEDGRIIYYSQEQDKKYLVYPTEEREGGILLPAEKFISDKELLIFSAGSGIYIFNSDMRGVAPREIRDKADFDKEEYKRLYGHLIHKSFYSFDHHTPKYIIATCYDDCGFPYEKKSAIGQSLMLRLSVSEKTNIRVKINTESEKDILHNIKASIEEKTVDVYQNSAIPLPVAEKAHRFNSKQIIIEAEDYCSPIAFHSLAFRYLIEEKIKKG